MQTEIIKIITKKLALNLLILLTILFLVIAVAGIPIDFDINSFNGEYKANMDIQAIIGNIKENFKIFFTGEAFQVMIQGQTTKELLVTTAKKSSLIIIGGVFLSIIIGIPKGIIDSRKNNRGGSIRLLQSLIPLSVPDILTIALVQLFALYLFKNNISLFGFEPIPHFGDESFKNAIFPIISISVLPAAYISRITSDIIENSFTKPYILAARGKGCSRFQIIKNHMMKSIFYGVLSGLPTVIGIIFSSLIIVERLYHFRGLGYYLIYFYTSQVIPPYEAGVAFTTFIVILAIFYYLIFIILNELKNIILPQMKSH